MVLSAMTSADHTGEPRGRRLSRVIAPYREIFAVPNAWRFSAAGVIGRMPMAMFGLGTVLFISGITGHYGVAGAVSAVGSLGYAFVAPQAARVVDRLGQRRVLLPLALVFASSTALLILTVSLHAPVWAWFIPGALAGATMPSLGAMVRARWSMLLAGTTSLHTAFSFESVADEICFVLGPAMVTLLATQVAPPAGVAVAAVLCVGGTIWFAAQRSTEPPTRLSAAAAAVAATPAPAAAAPTTVDVTSTGIERGRCHIDKRGAWFGKRGAWFAAPGLVVMVPVYVCLGGMFVSVDLSTVAFAQHFGHKPLAGFILGTYAFGSATGGLFYGARHWRSPVSRRFVITLAVTVAGVATFWAQPNLITLTCAIYLCGLTIAPTLIAGYSIVESQALSGRLTEATTWLSTGISVGVAFGSTVVGFVLDSEGPRRGYLLAACCGGVALLVSLAGSRRLRTS
jgi:MFS family permease